MSACSNQTVSIVRDGVDFVEFEIERAPGGDRTIGIPEYNLTVTNPVLPEE